MPKRLPQPPSFTLPLEREEHWTLHHVLLDRIDRETTANTGESDPPSIEVFQAFETLDSGDTSFTIAQLKAIQNVLAEYHHSPTWWEIERPRLEQLLHRATQLIEQHQTVLALNELKKHPEDE